MVDIDWKDGAKTEPETVGIPAISQYDVADSRHELVVVAHELTATGKIFASSWQLFYDKGGEFDQMNASDQTSAMTALKTRFCRQIMQPRQTWSQPTGYEYVHPANNDALFRVTTLLDLTFECQEKNPVCQDVGQGNEYFTYTVKWKDIVSEPTVGTTFSDAVPFKLDKTNSSTDHKIELRLDNNRDLPATFTQAQSGDGSFTLTFSVCAVDKADSANQFCSTDLQVKYFDCKSGFFSFKQTNPVTKVNGGSYLNPHVAGGSSVPYFDVGLTETNKSDLRQFRVDIVVQNQAKCGSYSLSVDQSGYSVSPVSSTQYTIGYRPTDNFDTATQRDDVNTVTVRIKNTDSSVQVTYTFDVKVWSCISNSTPALWVINVTEEAPSPPKSKTYTDFEVDLGMNPEICQLTGQADTFTLAGGWPASLQNLLTPSNHVLALSHNYNVLKVLPGRYSGVHQRGHTSESFEILLCYFTLWSGHTGNPSKTFATSKKNTYRIDTLEVSRLPSNEALCSNPIYPFVTLPGSDFDPLTSIVTANVSGGEGNNVWFQGWSNWVSATANPVVVNIGLQLTYRGTTDVAQTKHFLIKVVNCDTMTSLQANPVTFPAEQTVEFGTNFSTKLEWGYFTYAAGDYTSYCPITSSQIILNFAGDSPGVLTIYVKASNGEFHHGNTNNGDFNVVGKWQQCSFQGATKGLCTQESFWTESSKSLYFGDHTVRIRGGYQKSDSTWFYDASSELTFTLKIFDLCKKLDAISFKDESKLLSINGIIPAVFLPTSLSIDISLFDTAPYLQLFVDVTQINTNVGLCGALKLGVEAVEHVTNTVLTHVSVAQPATSLITLQYSANTLPANVYQRSLTLRLKAWHSSQTVVTISKAIDVYEYDCSGRFTTSNFGQLQPVHLNTIASDQEFTLSVSPSTPDPFCLDSNMYVYSFSGPGLTGSQGINTVPWLTHQTHNKFDVKASAKTAAKEGVYTGVVNRYHLEQSEPDTSFELVLCKITQPNQATNKYQSGTAEPFGIDVSSVKTSLNISLQPYTVNDSARCGPLVYDFETTPFDAVGTGHTTVAANQITFNNINQAGLYPLGRITVKVKVRASGTSDYAFEETFEIDIVNCLQEPFTMSGESPLKDSVLELRFPFADITKAFSETLTFDNTAAQHACAVHEYRITCQDNQLDLKARYSGSSHVSPPVVKTNKYQNAATLQSDSDPCSKFIVDASNAAKSVTFSTASYSGDKSSYEGEYLLTGEPFHDTNTAYATSYSFSVKLRLNCDEVVIIEPPGKLQFVIAPPAGAPNMPSPGTVLSDDLYFWMRSTASYPLHGNFVNPHPYSCILEQKLCETKDGGLTCDGARTKSILFIDMDISGAVPQLNVSSSYNMFHQQPWAIMMYEASLKGSTSRKPLTFKYFIFPDCGATSDVDELLGPQEVVNGAFQIDGSSESELVKSLTLPVSRETFELPHIANQYSCPLQAHLESHAQKSADLNAGATSSFFFISYIVPGQLTLYFKPRSNTQVQAYDHPADTIKCDLSTLGTRTCEIDYWVNAVSVNGTVGVQTTGKITVSSECLYIKTRHESTELSFWWKSKAAQATYDPSLEAGYEIRGPKMAFELPQVRPTLASGNDIFTRCGTLTYTVTIDSAKPGPYDSAFSLTYAAIENYDSANVTVETDDQSYALHSGIDNKDYRTLYEFSLTAQLDEFKDVFTFSYPNVPFFVRDYCAGMHLSEPPLIRPYTRTQNITQGAEKEEVAPEETKWINKVTKYLMSEVTTFGLAYMSYTKWCPPENCGPKIVNQECGTLTYTIVFKSWVQVWEGSSIIARPLGSAYFNDFGTIHIIDVTKRKQIGDHYAHLEVKSDLVPVSTKQIITFELEILDCFVTNFFTGPQVFRDVELPKDKSVTFGIIEYEQEPSCGFAIDYTVTLVQKPLGSESRKIFPQEFEGWQPEPPFVSLANNEVRIAPSAKNEGFSYAVFINGNLNVNSTVQGPVNAVSQQFDVQIPSTVIKVGNTAPKVSNKVASLMVLPNEPTVRTVGLPFDPQLDDYWVLEWGINGLEEDEAQEVLNWVSFVNVTVSDGIKFRFEPKDVHAGMKFTIYYALQEADEKHSKISEFEFSVTVGNFDIDTSQRDEQESTSVDKPPEIVRVFVDAPDDQGRMTLRFSKFIKLPSNATEWTSENEGADRISIEFIASETTQTLLYDQDLSLDLSWSLIKANVKNQDALPYQRMLQSTSLAEKKKETTVEINRLELQLNFTQPAIVSSQNYDSIQLQVLPEMFREETNQKPEDQVIFMQMNKRDFVKKHRVPKLKNAGMIATAKEVAKSTTNFISSFIGTNLFLSIFSAGALQYLWGLINSLQMIVMTALFRIDIADNADMIMVAILEIVSLDFVETDEVINALFDYRETPIFMAEDRGGDELESKFGDAGYDSSNYVLLLGPIFPIASAYLLFNILRCLAQLSCRKCGENCLTRRIRSNIAQKVVILRFILEGCVEMGISAMISVLLVSSTQVAQSQREIRLVQMEDQTFREPWELFAIVLAFLTLALLLVAPIYLIKLTRVYLKELEKPKEKQQLNLEVVKLFEDFRKNEPALRYPVIFFYRRYAIILILTIMPGLKFAQIFGHLVSTGVVVSYLFGKQPYAKRSMTVKEGINEVIVLLAGYPLLVFTSWISDEERLIEAGWAIVGCIVAIILFNITFFIVSVGTKEYRKLKFWCIRRQRINNYKRMIQLQREMNLQQKKRLEYIENLFRPDPPFLKSPEVGAQAVLLASKQALQTRTEVVLKELDRQFGVPQQSLIQNFALSKATGHKEQRKHTAKEVQPNENQLLSISSDDIGEQLMQAAEELERQGVQPVQPAAPYEGQDSSLVMCNVAGLMVRRPREYPNVPAAAESYRLEPTKQYPTPIAPNAKQLVSLKLGKTNQPSLSQPAGVPPPLPVIIPPPTNANEEIDPYLFQLPARGASKKQGPLMSNKRLGITQESNGDDMSRQLKRFANDIQADKELFLQLHPTITGNPKQRKE